MENNYFEFEDKLYKQIHGKSMGTKVAPVYANLFLGKFEEENILNTNDSKNIIFYKRFLDDIFLLWKGDKTTKLKI